MSDGINGTCGIGGPVVMHSLLPFLEKSTPKLMLVTVLMVPMVSAV